MVGAVVYERGYYPTVVFLILVSILNAIIILALLILKKFYLVLITSMILLGIIFQIKKHLNLNKIVKIPLVEFKFDYVSIRNVRKEEILNIPYKDIISIRREYGYYNYIFTLQIKSGNEVHVGTFLKKDAEKVLNGFLSNMRHLKPKYGWVTNLYAEYT